mmetsp:Transcript_126263/g.368953  ORF Transcript_126263/g.368953 Transcript_126263/m.368953 type:complete len:286 (+) Transcript_126263:90-947(+)
MVQCSGRSELPEPAAESRPLAARGPAPVPRVPLGRPLLPDDLRPAGHGHLLRAGRRREALPPRPALRGRLARRDVLQPHPPAGPVPRARLDHRVVRREREQPDRRTLRGQLHRLPRRPGPPLRIRRLALPRRRPHAEPPLPDVARGGRSLRAGLAGPAAAPRSHRARADRAWLALLLALRHGRAPLPGHVRAHGTGVLPLLLPVAHLCGRHAPAQVEARDHAGPRAMVLRRSELRGGRRPCGALPVGRHLDARGGAPREVVAQQVGRLRGEQPAGGTLPIRVLLV